MKQNILDLTKKELENEIKPAFRAKQIYQWIYQKYADSFEDMSNLPKNLRTELADRYILSPLELRREEQSKDGSKKYLFALTDGLTIETVLLPMKLEEFDEDGIRVHHTRYTVCVSSQVGCKMGCAFCLTAKGGFVRNLSAGEITAQVLFIKKINNIDASRRVNVVYMGMGEPLDNLQNVVKAVEIFADIDGLSISPRRQTISTSGLSSQIEKLGKMNIGALLAISLHAIDDETRVKLMPINKAYNIKSIIDAVKTFPIDVRKRVLFEYLIIKDVNDSMQSAKKLVKLLNNIKAKVNLIYFNPHAGSEFQRPNEKDVTAFADFLNSHGLLCTIRQSKGLDISAACGQLKQRQENGLA
ncbi:MAG: 23S rRNA (adenine(2503)-C(2))-methyltransferase RlmN [Campylobacteraceae bacterium]|jgi:23S rRNA (adenine2503-C2)-methyltransferase|nr:23S rRNA (adenine(2503)-C(2))-methyltransferase RlmN [Campylobacteraceae bacterium]